MYGVFRFRSVKSFAPSIPASVSGVMLVQWPPFAWTTVPWIPLDAVGEGAPDGPERMAQPATTAMSATPRPDARTAQRRLELAPVLPVRVGPGLAPCPAEPLVRGPVPV